MLGKIDRYDGAAPVRPVSHSLLIHTLYVAYLTGPGLGSVRLSTRPRPVPVRRRCAALETNLQSKPITHFTS